MERKGTLQRYPSISEWGKGDFSTKVGKKDAAVMLSLRKALGIWCQKGPWLKASINLVFLLCSKVSAAAFGTLHISNISLSLAINLSHHSYRMRQKTNSESKLLFSSLEKKSDKSCQCTFCYPTTPCFIDFSGHLLFSPLGSAPRFFDVKNLDGHVRKCIEWWSKTKTWWIRRFSSSSSTSSSSMPFPFAFCWCFVLSCFPHKHNGS